jgi:hypothetical protein
MVSENYGAVNTTCAPKTLGHKYTRQTKKTAER